MGTRPREQALEIEEEPGIGAGVAVDHLVVVTHTEDLHAGRSQQPQQQYVGRGEVLELVDQQMPALALPMGSEVCVGAQHFDGAVDLLVVVCFTVPFEHVAVVPERLGEARHVVT